MIGVYFVASVDEQPEAVYFSEEDAFTSGFNYIDVFDEEGFKVVSYKLKNDNDQTCEDDYTINF